ncbi:MAG: RnfABCDGE type electron transport complex subunit D [Candidatus Aenigmatarchaeota archaeon]|nr:MAG: RnfABCDGE type electron transport complex subunit D [Candidatus Aenigmarchaeota archaeon]
MAFLDRVRGADVYDTILVFLYILAAIGIYKLGTDALITFAVTTTVAVAIDFVIYTIRKRPVNFRSLRKALITASFVAFLMPPGVALYLPALAATLAVLSKHVLHLPKKKHIFNPAAFGAFVTASLFALPVAWWGADAYAVWILGPLLIYRFKRLELPATLLLAYGVLSTVGLYAGLNTPRIDVVLMQNIPLVMLAFFMATEPVTSPYTRNGRIVFGALAAVTIFSAGVVGGIDALLGGLLVANVFTPLINRFTAPRLTQPQQSQTA